jgi:hypothetical protein
MLNILGLENKEQISRKQWAKYEDTSFFLKIIKK